MAPEHVSEHDDGFDQLASDDEDRVLYRPRRRCTDPLPVVPPLDVGHEAGARALVMLLWALARQQEERTDEP
jgi:hypothetical protein